MTRTTKNMLIKHDESGYPCLVPNLRGNAFSFSLLSMMLVVDLSYMAFVIFRCALSGPSLVLQMIKNLPLVQEAWVWSLCQENPLENGMTTHSSILAWRIPWREEPGGLHSPWGHKELDMSERLTLSLSCSLYAHFLERFYHKRMLNFVKSFLHL